MVKKPHQTAPTFSENALALLLEKEEREREKKRKVTKLRSVGRHQLMANLPQSLSMNPPFGVPSTSSANAAGGQGKDRKMASAEQLVLELSNPDLRENALLELSKVFSNT